MTPLEQLRELFHSIGKKGLRGLLVSALDEKLSGAKVFNGRKPGENISLNPLTINKLPLQIYKHFTSSSLSKDVSISLLCFLIFDFFIAIVKRFTIRSLHLLESNNGMQLSSITEGICSRVAQKAFRDRPD